MRGIKYGFILFFLPTTIRRPNRLVRPSRTPSLIENSFSGQTLTCAFSEFIDAI
jgi:hypothetical protein